MVSSAQPPSGGSCALPEGGKVMRIVRGRTAEHNQGCGGASIPLPDGRTAALSRGQVTRMLRNLSSEEERIIREGGEDARNLVSRLAAKMVAGR